MLALVVTVWGPARAHAQSPQSPQSPQSATQVRVLLGPLQGRSSDLQSVLQTALAGHAAEVELLPAAEYASAAGRAGVSASSTQPRDLGSVADAARADVVLVGALTPRTRRGFSLAVSVHRGGDGERAGGTTQELQSLSELALSTDSIYTALLRPMREARASRPALPAPPAPVTTAVIEPVAVPVVAPTPAPTPPVAPPPAAGPTTDETAALGVLRVRVGGTLSQRYWRMPVLGESSPRGYDNAGFPEITGDVTALVRFAGRRMGVGGSAGVAVPVMVTSRGYDSSGQPVLLPTSAFDLWGGLAYAYRLPHGGEFRAHAGAVYHAFSVDTAALPREQRLAPAVYLGGRGALEGALPVYARRGLELQVTFGTELRVVTIGRALAEAFGETSPLTFGLGGQAGVTLRLDRFAPGLAVGASASVLRYRTQFSGRTDVGTGSDSVDDYLRFGAFVAYDLLTPRLAP